MLAYSWRGNVRELQNCIERAVILTEGDTIHARHLNLSITTTAARRPSEDDRSRGRRSICPASMADASRRVLAEVERRKIVQALKEASGNAGAGGRDSSGELQDAAGEAEGLPRFS